MDSKHRETLEKSLSSSKFAVLGLKRPKGFSAEDGNQQSSCEEDQAVTHPGRKRRAVNRSGQIPLPSFLKKNSGGVRKAFEIPYGMFYHWALAEHKLIERELQGPSPFTPITQNIYSRRSAQIAAMRGSQNERCSCVYDKRRGIACGPDCFNRINLVECSKSTCPCYLATNKCGNMRFQNNEVKKCSVGFLGHLGFALILEEPVRRGDFILQYVGEVLDDEECAKRLKKYSSGHRGKKGGNSNHYILSMGDDLNIDATMKGCLGRFINHSCEPNCESSRWDVEGKACMGVFALRDLPAGTPVTFDYKFRRFGTDLQECFCGTPSCRKFLGAKVRRASQFSSSPNSNSSSGSSSSSESESDDDSSGSSSSGASDTSDDELTTDDEDDDAILPGDEAVSSSSSSSSSRNNVQEHMKQLMNGDVSSQLQGSNVGFLLRNVSKALAARKTQIDRLCETVFPGDGVHAF